MTDDLRIQLQEQARQAQFWRDRAQRVEAELAAIRAALSGVVERVGRIVRPDAAGPVETERRP